MSGGGDGLFTIIRPEEADKRHMVIVKCDLCEVAVGFDSRKVARVIGKIQEITLGHVCTKPEPKVKTRPELPERGVSEYERGSMKDRVNR